MQLANASPAQQQAEQQVETGGQKEPALSAVDAPARKPQDLSEADFHGYPPQARALATRSLPLLRVIPLPLLPLLLREVSALDYRFPRERERVLSQLKQLQAKDPPTRDRLLAPFRSFDLPMSLAAVDWVNDPGHYLDLLTAALWSSGQMPQFRSAAKNFIEALPDPAEPPRALPRQALIVLDASLTGSPAFHKLQSQGLSLRIAGSGGWTALLDHTRERARIHPGDYAHWYIDGAAPRREGNTTHDDGDGLTVISYDALTPVRAHLLARARNAMSAERSGPEQLRTLLAQTTPEQIGMQQSDAVLSHFQLSLLTEGSGTQIFATTFVQWAARECLRRAEPDTLLLRFTPRQAQQGMNEMLSGAPSTGLDPAGSLVDAEEGALYTWINLQRLSSAETSTCLVWHEGTSSAVALGPRLPAGKVLKETQTMQQALHLLG